MYRNLILFLTTTLLLGSCVKDNTYYRIEGFAQGSSYQVVCSPSAAPPPKS